jgi:hypothetical protein
MVEAAMDMLDQQHIPNLTAPGKADMQLGWLSRMGYCGVVDTDLLAHECTALFWNTRCMTGPRCISGVPGQQHIARAHAGGLAYERRASALMQCAASVGCDYRTMKHIDGEAAAGVLSQVTADLRAPVAKWEVVVRNAAAAASADLGSPATLIGSTACAPSR